MTDTLAAILLGILEGLTEFLPVSSTGHLILATEILGFDQDDWEVFNIAIQPAAILAIVVLYWRTFWDVAKGLFGFEKGAIAFVRNLLVAFFPAVLLGLAFGDIIQGFLGNVTLVCWSLILGGVAILAVERWANPPAEGPGVAGVPLRTAVLIGLVQCLAMIPGVSRSGATILGAMAFGVDRKTAAEFSFFLAVPTLSGATVYQLAKHGANLTTDDGQLIAIGSAVGFVTALVVVKLFVAVVTKIGFSPFAWYRIALGLGGLAWLSLR
ncbi:undecaprenyl-diphosphate phosphatase [Erythrobacter sp. BLCC-B19]|uniref:undecaprenyl-diphosphate phosphatase n=1 Tax=Erythrobacter sp. BLCC-B19 TaxID=3025315 RepID=UPI002361ADE0|nr:undecaprenyl-diphosphate phosphatase [Erythrobacter sp. BLCC-B19]WDA42489.1 undecaprenyl-diphosphate phosphatase [Erythrobacter sp. BLCC-B19]